MDEWEIAQIYGGRYLLMMKIKWENKNKINHGYGG